MSTAEQASSIKRSMAEAQSLAPNQLAAQLRFYAPYASGEKMKSVMLAAAKHLEGEQEKKGEEHGSVRE